MPLKIKRIEVIKASGKGAESHTHSEERYSKWKKVSKQPTRPDTRTPLSCRVTKTPDTFQTHDVPMFITIVCVFNPPPPFFFLRQ